MSEKTDPDRADLEELRLRSQELFQRAAEPAEEAKAIARKVDQLAAKKARAAGARHSERRG